MKECLARVVDNSPLCDTMFQLTLRCDGLFEDGAEAGQFVNIAVNNPSLPLRRPISIYAIDRQKREIRLAVQAKGEGTLALLRSKKGDELSLLGALGNAFSWFVPNNAKRVFLVGGGVGVAPVRCAFDELSAKYDCSLFAGYRNVGLVYGLDGIEKERVFAVSDDGSFGEKALVTKPLGEQIEKNKPDVILACGPAPMLRAVSDLSEKHGIACAVSLEQRMGCGLGACLVCSCKVKAKTPEGYAYRRVCADGPIFDAREVIF
ncbi:MAG: dihydroorotate dehydrogenase electron transfer subunit [Eubacteriales bacterium]|nr:dihydroorotate dehydrogenase electron transfer subunit [Eubacteriales bacterium]MDD3883204.1 dihydroorotate dehydrogenase electron transfer subunit [Eubacteriales bacterium]MDD4512720.1 dihydroorotate dehydrogenase electron transfer subunit [Eubacteriales bacterium]